MLFFNGPNYLHSSIEKDRIYHMQNRIEINEIVEIAVKRLLQFDYMISAILFGSFAEGRENDMSDIDIGVLVSKELSLIEVGFLAAGMEMVFKRRVDLVILNDLYKKNPLLAYEIITKGNLMFCRDQEKLVELKTNTILSFLDMLPLRDAVTRKFQERLQNGRFGDRNYA